MVKSMQNLTKKGKKDERSIFRGLYFMKGSTPLYCFEIETRTQEEERLIKKFLFSVGGSDPKCASFGQKCLKMAKASYFRFYVSNEEFHWLKLIQHMPFFG